ncbi:MAG: hypothetical protein U9N54_10855 [candidate division Zixibacteria bacterium]|nr:hypothetical protein [candidate division Zixibacteria bacterium]
MIQFARRILDNGLVVLLSLLLVGSIILGFLNDSKKKKIVRLLDNHISEIISSSIESLYYQNGINGSLLRTNFSGRNEMGKSGEIEIVCSL